MQNKRTVATAVLGVGFVQPLLFSLLSTQALAQGDTWETKAPMAIATAGMEGGFVDGKLYLVGGGTNTSHTLAVEVYDPVADTWDYLQPAPIQYSGHAAAAIGNKLYLVGGCAGDCSTPTNILQAYDPLAETWTTLASMPSSRGGIAAAAIDGKLYVVGGFVRWYTDVNWLEVYDPATNTWARLADMPTARAGLQAVAIDGKLYVVGGFIRSGPGSPEGDLTGKLEVYDPGSGTWATRADMPTARAELAIASIDGRLYAAGGSNSLLSGVDTLEEYDPATDTWVARATMATGRWAAGFGQNNGRLYVAGGIVTYPGGAATTMEVYTPPLMNEAPTAEAGDNQSIHVGQNIELDGSGSTDDNTASEDLLYTWSFSAMPAGSTAVLADADTVSASFIADLPGDYVVSLVVTDEGALSSAPDEVMISSWNTPPTANAGPDQGSYVGNSVLLDGTASSDADLDPLTYAWTLSSRPAGSHAMLSGADSAVATFLPDLAGTYVSQLVVNDGYADSEPDEVNTVVITTEHFAEGQAVEALNVVSGLPPASVTTTGNQTALGNLLLQVIESLQDGDLSRALRKLEAVVERTDGCALRGSPDAGGGGGGNPPARDYVANCTDQAVIYPALMDALDALTP